MLSKRVHCIPIEQQSVKRIELILSVLIITHSKKQGHKETFGGDGYVYYLDDGDSIMGVCVCPDSSNCTH